MPVIVLNILMTDPEHHRRGAGALHLQWGIEEAAKLGLPMYLEGSTFGRPLYERFGFKIYKVVTFDLAKYGAGSGTEENCVMMRDTERMS
jgi:GNAT superfamily N-acetyltransferase